MGWQALAPLLEGFGYLAFTGTAMRPFHLMHILHEIVINSRRGIIEFGSGISTLLMGRL